MLIKKVVVFDPLVIKVCERNSEKPVGYLPREILRVTKFIIEWGATVDVELTSDYFRLPLVQGGLEIKCKVTVKVPNTTPRQVTERYRSLVEERCDKPKEEEIIGSFILVNNSKNMDEDLSINQRSARRSRKTQPNKPNEITAKSTAKNRTFFNKETL